MRKAADRRIERATVASALLGRLIDPATRRQGFADARLVTDWRTIVGAERALDTLPLKLDRRTRTLVLRVRPSAALLVQHEEPQLLERINAFFGTTIALRLRIVQGRVPEPPAPAPEVTLTAAEEAAVAAAVADVEPPELRASLAALGRAVKRRRKAATTSPLETDGRDH